jgi:nucleoside-diphosphate-sugar epimerase
MNLQKVARRLGWRPRIGVSEGIESLWAWVSEHRALFGHPA